MYPAAGREESGTLLPFEEGAAKDDFEEDMKAGNDKDDEDEDADMPSSPGDCGARC
jgi:hypothetical protein